MIKKHFKITSGRSKFTLINSINNVRALRITNFRWTTSNPADFICHIVIKNFDKNEYINGNGFEFKYTKAMAIVEYGGTPIIWESVNSIPDVVHDSVVSIKQLEIEIYIDEQLTSDITTLNPLYLEIEFLTE
jgi:hypothetical protein